MTTLLLIRHAAYDEATGHLTPAGRDQATVVAAALAASAIVAVYASPAVRTRETAAPLAAACGVAVTVADGWAEADFAPAAWAAVAVDAAGQTWLAVQARVAAAMRELIAAHPDAAVAVVTHADVVRAAVGLCLGVPAELLLRIAVDHASVTTLHMDEAGPTVGAVNHLARRDSVTVNDFGGLDE